MYVKVLSEMNCGETNSEYGLRVYKNGKREKGKPAMGQHSPLWVTWSARMWASHLVLLLRVLPHHDGPEPWAKNLLPLLSCCPLCGHWDREQEEQQMRPEGRDLVCPKVRSRLLNALSHHPDTRGRSEVIDTTSIYYLAQRISIVVKLQQNLKRGSVGWKWKI